MFAALGLGFFRENADNQAQGGELLSSYSKNVLVKIVNYIMLTIHTLKILQAWPSESKVLPFFRAFARPHSPTLLD